MNYFRNCPISLCDISCIHHLFIYLLLLFSCAISQNMEMPSLKCRLVILAGVVAVGIILAYISKRDLNLLSGEPIVFTTTTRPPLPGELGSILKLYHTRMAVRERTIVNPHNFKYIINNQAACDNKDVEILITVLTRIKRYY